MATRLSRPGNFPAQPPRCAGTAARVGLGALGEPEKLGLRSSGTRGVAGRLALRGPLSDPQAALTHSHCPGKCSAMTAGSTTCGTTSEARQVRPGAERVGNSGLPARGTPVHPRRGRGLGRGVLSLVREEEGKVRGLLGTECPHTACFLQAAHCDAWCRPITQTVCTKLWESRSCPTRANSATPPCRAQPGWHPAATAPCWGSSSVRATWENTRADPLKPPCKSSATSPDPH